MLFKDIIGQNALKRQLIYKVQADKVSHAMLFLGSSGYGGLPLALALAQYLNCENRTESDSCGVCSSCIKAQKLVHPDIHFSYPYFPSKEDKVKLSVDVIDQWRKSILHDPYLTLHEWVSVFNGENKQPNIPIDECHNIIHRLSFKTFESPYKVLIMWLPEYLGKEGNSLLKIIEEPSEKTIFLLVAENADRILPTILSRTQITRIPPVETDLMAAALQQKFQIEQQEALQLAAISNGDFKEASAYLENASTSLSVLFADWMNLCIPNKNSERIFLLYTFIEKFAGLGRENQKGFLKYTLHFFHEALNAGYSNSASAIFGEEEKMLLKKISDLTDLQTMQDLYNEVNEAHYHLERNAHPKILMMHLSMSVARMLKEKKLILS